MPRGLLPRPFQTMGVLCGALLFAQSAPPAWQEYPGSPPGRAGVAEPAAFELPDPDQNARLQQLLSRLAEHSDDTAALEQLDRLLAEVMSEAREHGDEGRLREMAQLLQVVRSVNPEKAGLESAHGRLRQLEQIQDWLGQAGAALRRERLIEPPEGNAAYWYGRVLQADPTNEKALAGMGRVRQDLVERAYAAAADSDYELAFEWLEEAERVAVEPGPVDRARANIVAGREREARRIERDIEALLAEGAFRQAEFALLDLIALGAGPDRIAGIRDRIEAARLYGGHAAGEVIEDAVGGQGGPVPEVVVLAPGSYMMGAPKDEEGRTDNEGPRRRVTLSRGFAMGRHEVTVGEFRAFVAATGYRTSAEADGHSPVYNDRTGRLSDRKGVNWRHDYAGRKAREDHPVIHVSWNDANAYVNWLAKRTGKPYRLPSEAEFEYALRAGTASRFWWGEGSPERAVENLTAEADVSPQDRRWTAAFEGYSDGHWGPAPVASLAANPFGLHDMAGNVSEWVADCWHPSYVRAPMDGRAWTNPGCARRVVRGGYWAGAPRQARSAARLSAAADLHGPRVGFRVARDL